MCIRLPLPVKAKLAMEVDKQQRSLNDLVREALGRHYNVKVQLSGRRSTAAVSPTKPVIVLRVPSELEEKVRCDAFARRSNLTHRVGEVLSTELGVAVEMGRPKRTVPFGGAPRRVS